MLSKKAITAKVEKPSKSLELGSTKEATASLIDYARSVTKGQATTSQLAKLISHVVTEKAVSVMDHVISELDKVDPSLNAKRLLKERLDDRKTEIFKESDLDKKKTLVKKYLKENYVEEKVCRYVIEFAVMVNKYSEENVKHFLMDLGQYHMINYDTWIATKKALTRFYYHVNKRQMVLPKNFNKEMVKKKTEVINEIAMDSLVIARLCDSYEILRSSIMALLIFKGKYKMKSLSACKVNGLLMDELRDDGSHKYWLKAPTGKYLEIDEGCFMLLKESLRMYFEKIAESYEVKAKSAKIAMKKHAKCEDKKMKFNFERFKNLHQTMSSQNFEKKKEEYCYVLSSENFAKNDIDKKTFPLFEFTKPNTLLSEFNLGFEKYLKERLQIHPDMFNPLPKKCKIEIPPMKFEEMSEDLIKKKKYLFCFPFKATNLKVKISKFVDDPQRIAKYVEIHMDDESIFNDKRSHHKATRNELKSITSEIMKSTKQHFKKRDSKSSYKINSS
jgi:hypothetical protein